jgi:hypothetical protein
MAEKVLSEEEIKKWNEISEARDKKEEGKDPCFVGIIALVAISILGTIAVLVHTGHKYGGENGVGAAFGLILGILLTAAAGFLIVKAFVAQAIEKYTSDFYTPEYGGDFWLFFSMGFSATIVLIYGTNGLHMGLEPLFLGSFSAEIVFFAVCSLALTLLPARLFIFEEVKSGERSELGSAKFKAELAKEAASKKAKNG